MDKYYHFTTYNSINNIKIYGLLPLNGYRCQTVNDKRCGVFLSKGMDNSIVMYALMLGHFEKYRGTAGSIHIQNNMFEIEQLNQKRVHSFNPRRFDRMINELTYEINLINSIRSCGNFSNFLGGDGCFLSINGLVGINEDEGQSDCVYNRIIPPYYINVVGLINKDTKSYIDSREAVLAYFMSNYRIEDILKLVTDNNKIDIYRLYENNKDLDYINYNPTLFDLVEIPISLYNYENPKVKTLVY